LYHDLLLSSHPNSQPGTPPRGRRNPRRSDRIPNAEPNPHFLSDPEENDHDDLEDQRFLSEPEHSDAAASRIVLKHGRIQHGDEYDPQVPLLLEEKVNTGSYMGTDTDNELRAERVFQNTRRSGKGNSSRLQAQFLPTLRASNRRKRRKQRALKPQFVDADGTDSETDVAPPLIDLPDVKKTWRVAAHCFAKKLDRDEVLKFCSRRWNTKELNEEVIHIVTGTMLDRVEGFRGALKQDLFIFTTFGSIVCWGMTEDQEQNILALLTSSVDLEDSVPKVDSDDYDFGYTESSNFNVVRDTFLLPLRLLDSKRDTVYKLSCSYALSTSVKLGVFEEQVDRVIHATEHIPKELATHGRVMSLSRTEVSKRIGELFIYKASLNLMYDILDAPEFFWDFSELEEVYNRSRKHVEVENRVEVLNKRMEVLSELLSILQEEKSESHSSRLEWIVIWLIIMEVIIGAVEIFVSLWK
jgi:uncharacterized Rmd1/YagE family protein